MTTVERIRSILDERKIPYARVEKACGFSNGYIGQLKKSIPDDRLYKIAKYLDVSPAYLITGEEPEQEENNLGLREALRNRPDMRILFEVSKDAPPSAILEAAALLMRYKEESENK